MGGPYQQQLQEVRLNVSPGPDKALSLCEDYELLLFGPSEQSRLLVATSITDQAGTKSIDAPPPALPYYPASIVVTRCVYAIFFFYCRSLICVRVFLSAPAYVPRQVDESSHQVVVMQMYRSLRYLSPRVPQSNYSQVIKSWPLNCQHSYLKSNNKCGTHVRR